MERSQLKKFKKGSWWDEVKPKKACILKPSGERASSESVSHSVVSNSAILWTVACQAPLSLGYPRQEHWTGLPFPSLGNLPDPEVEPASSALAGGFFTTELPWKPNTVILLHFISSGFPTVLSCSFPPKWCNRETRNSEDKGKLDGGKNQRQRERGEREKNFFSGGKIWRLMWKQKGFPGGASGKAPTCQCRRHNWVRKIPWRRKWQPTPVCLCGESHG